MSKWQFVAEDANPAVGESLLEEIWCMRLHDISWNDIMQWLHTSTVSSGYTFPLGNQVYRLFVILCTHVESFEDQMRCILACSVGI